MYLVREIEKTDNKIGKDRIYLSPVNRQRDTVGSKRWIYGMHLLAGISDGSIKHYKVKP